MKGLGYLALLVAVATGSASAMNGMTGGDGGPKLGGWRKVKATHELKDKLVTALTKGDDNYAEGVRTRLCVTQLKFVDQQVVAGTKYRFRIMGCDVGADFARVGRCRDADANCVPSSYAVEVFEQPWTDTLQVVGITVESGPALHMNGDEVSDEEKQLIDEWLKRDNRNRFGDPKGTSYPGGTPLFNETTGEVGDRIKYIVSKHPDRPWLPTEAPMMGMVRASPLSLSAEEVKAKAAQRDAFNSTYITSLAVFGTLAMAVAAIAFVKARQTERRRFAYDTVSRSET